jgi:DNA-binding response OmpR family regulator
MKKTILIVENDSEIRNVISYILQTEGFEVIATSPKPATQLINHNANLILLDEWLHKKEGHMLCTEIKKIHEMKHLPVIILSTAHNIEEIAETCHADGFVRKPFDIGHLVDVVKKCLSSDINALV